MEIIGKAIEIIMVFITISMLAGYTLAQKAVMLACSAKNLIFFIGREIVTVICFICMLFIMFVYSKVHNLFLKKHEEIAVQG